MKKFKMFTLLAKFLRLNKIIIERKNTKEHLEILENQGVMKLNNKFEMILRRTIFLKWNDDLVKIKRRSIIEIIKQEKFSFVQSNTEEIIFVKDQAEISDIKQIIA